MNERFCKQCVMPVTRPDTPFQDNLCPACRYAAAKIDIDWKSRETQFLELAASGKKKCAYDCVIPVSGGKDSMWQVLKIKELGLNPLCVCFETTLPTTVGIQNLEALRNLGVDLLHIKRNPIIFQKLTYKGFKELGNAQWPLFLGAYCSPIRVAVAFQIPRVIWGENPQAEYGGQAGDATKNQLDRHWVYQLGGLNNKTARDMLGEGVGPQDIFFYEYPSQEEISKLELKSVFLGYYFKWDRDGQLGRIFKKGWRGLSHRTENSYTDFIGIDCDALQIHTYLKYVKFGYGRATDDACIDIRNGRISREEGLRLVKKYDGCVPHAARRRFIDYLQISESEYEVIVDSFTNRNIFKTDAAGHFLRDRDGSLVKKEEWIPR